MKQKVVIKVSFNGEKKSRTKVMQAAVGVPGVGSIAFGDEDNDQIVIIGDDGLDSVNLTCILRKKVRFAELLSVSSVDEKKEVAKMTTGSAANGLANLSSWCPTVFLPSCWR